jgi:hypothetical protein
MTTAVEYRQYAEESLHLLRFAKSPEVRAALLLMAQRWNRLAYFVERVASVKPAGE